MYLDPEPLFCFLGLADGNHYCSFKLEYIKLSFELNAFVFFLRDCVLKWLNWSLNFFPVFLGMNINFIHLNWKKILKW